MQVILWVIGGITLLMVAGLVLTRQLVHAAFWLFAVLMAVAAWMVMSGALFVAISQIIVYVGGILILIVFGVMLTNSGLLTLPEPPTSGAWSGWLAGLAAMVLLGGMAFSTDWDSILSTRVLPAPTGMTHPELVGAHLLTDWLLLFELAGVLLWVALVGAAYIARSGRADQP